MEYLITTFEKISAERSTPVTSTPVLVEFQFNIGNGLFADVSAEVIEETDADGFTTSNDITIIDVLVPARDKSQPPPMGFRQTQIFPYAAGYPKEFRTAIEQKAVECSHNSKYHIKN